MNNLNYIYKWWSDWYFTDWKNKNTISETKRFTCRVYAGLQSEACGKRTPDLRCPAVWTEFTDAQTWTHPTCFRPEQDRRRVWSGSLLLRWGTGCTRTLPSPGDAQWHNTSTVNPLMFHILRYGNIRKIVDSWSYRTRTVTTSPWEPFWLFVDETMNL